MFSVFKRKTSLEASAQALYGRILAQARKPVFYALYGVPDTQPARFDLLLALMFPFISRLKDEGATGRDFNQALFDALFADMDQSLREIGIGDMGVPKRMKAMMRAFNGRMHAYEDAKSDNDAFIDALRRNLYPEAPNIEESQIRKMAYYLDLMQKSLRSKSFMDIIEGYSHFIDP